MYYGNIKTYDIADGPGVRVSLFVSGCRHHCKGCFNAETWNFDYGQPYIQETEDGEFVEELKDITLLFRGSRNQRLICLKDGKDVGRYDELVKR